MKIGMLERVVEFLKLGRQDALAGEKQRVGHFTEDQAQGKRRRGKKRGAVQGGRESSRELGVGYGLRRDDIDRAADVLIFER